MKEVDLLVRRRVSIPTTPSEWELYDKEGVDAASLNLAAALQRAASAGAEEGRRIILEVMMHYQGYGAMDSEPREVAGRVFRDIFGQEL